MTEEEIVEAVARAICHQKLYDPDRVLANGKTIMWQIHIPQARAAIAAYQKAVAGQAVDSHIRFKRSNGKWSEWMTGDAKRFATLAEKHEYEERPLFAAPPAPQPVTGQAVGGWTPPQDCDGKEQFAFEAWASGKHYDMQEHHLLYVFMDKRTDAARQGWKAALKYVRDTFAAYEPEASR